ncbi:MAG TPA: MAPEG family protein [Tianweitania sediminis]|jgi:uncharacterized MAPEG superfamily protein|nr:MAPEG family protein [Tianweitania sediminis]
MPVLTEAAQSFLQLGAWSVLLLFVHIALQGMFATRDLGLDYNASPRDEQKTPTSRQAQRAERASLNFRETYPAFVLLVLGLAIAGQDTTTGFLGAWLWFLARIIYYPLYLMGIPYIRSVVWLASLIGLLLMFIALVSA